MRKEAKALITGGASIIGVLLVSLLAHRPLYPERYATPVEVSETVVEAKRGHVVTFALRHFN